MSDDSHDPSASRRRAFLDSAIIIAGVTALGYVSSFLFQYGAATKYGVPAELVKLNLELVISGSFMALILFAMVALTMWFARLLVERTGSARPGLGIFTGIFFFSTFGLGFVDPTYFVLAAIIGPIGLVVLIRPQILSKVITALKSRSTGTEGLLGRHPTLEIILICALMVMAFASPLGKLAAQIRVKYPILETEPEQVVLLLYGETLICAPLQREERSYEPIYTILNLSRDGPITVRPERVGPLSMQLSGVSDPGN